MAGPMDLRGRVVISDGASSTLRAIRGNLDGVANTATRLQRSLNAVQTAGAQVRKAGAAVTGGAVAAGGVVKTIIDQTKAFNEAKFGYGFARITDYIKDGRLDMAGWRADMNRTADDARKAARQFGTLPQITMKAREEVEKLGFKGKESESIFGAAMGLHLSEPGALASGEAAKYVGAVYRAYTKEREELAKRLGRDAEDPEFKNAYIKGLAGKAAVAGAESALGPADIVEGMRQFAPQWAGMGVDYNFALAMLAHGSNFGFRAPELGTAYKSLMTKIINPTDAGLRTLNALGIDRSKFMEQAPADPAKAAAQLNSLLSGSLYAKGGKAKKARIREMLDFAYKNGQTGTPEFQEALTNEVMGMLGKGWEGRAGDVQQAVANATITGQGGVNMPAFLKSLRDAGATVGQIATIFEGRHVARYTPTFQHYEKLIELYDKLNATDGSVVDAVVEGRKASEAGKTDRLSGAWEELMVVLEQSGGLIDTLKTKITGALDAISGSGNAAATAITAAAVGLAGLAGAGLTIAGLRGLGIGGMRGAPMTDSQRMIAGMTGAAAGAGGVGWMARMKGVGGSLAGGLAYLLPGVGQYLATRDLWRSGGGLLGSIRAGGWRAGMMVPGLGTLFAALGLGSSVYSGVQKYRETGSVLEGVKEGSGWNGLMGLGAWAFGGGQAQAATPGTAPAVPPGASVPGVAPQMGADGQTAGSAAGMEEGVRAAIERMRAMASSVDLTADGVRAGQSFASGVASGLESAVAAVESAGARMQAAASRIQLNTGPAMGGAR